MDGGKLKLTLSCGEYDINRGLLDGSVQPEGIELVPIPLISPERHWRVLHGHEFDVCELSMAMYLLLRERRLHPYVAIPVFPHRRFRHSFIFVRADSGIATPKDLEGRRVGTRVWLNTAALWTKGILADEYGVDLTSIQWFTQDEEDIAFQPPERFSVQRVGRERTVNQRLLDGELDALIYPEIPSSFKAGDPRVRRLFADAKAEEVSYYQRTGLFPIMHTVVIREELLERYPFVAQAMLKAFRASKELAWRKLEDPRLISLAFVRDLIEEQRALMGRDPWPYDLPSNRNALETLMRYAREQGIISREISVEELFFGPALEEMPVGYV